MHAHAYKKLACMRIHMRTLISLSVLACILTHEDHSTNRSTDRFSFEGLYYDYSAIVLR